MTGGKKSRNQTAQTSGAQPSTGRAKDFVFQRVEYALLGLSRNTLPLFGASAFRGHVLRLTPRTDNSVLHMHRLTIDPVPSFRQDLRDRYGNLITRLEFEGLSDHLRIESRFDLETRSTPALACSALLPPLPWPPGTSDAMADYLSPGDGDESVRAFATDLASESGWEAVDFLERLNQTLFTRTDRHIRPDGAAQAPAHTLATGRGACRDLAVLFMTACRSLGIAARFVSGYQANADTPDGRRHLHAWPEVFLPGFWLAGLRPDAWAFCHGWPFGAQRGAGPGRDHACGRRVLWRRRNLHARLRSADHGRAVMPGSVQACCCLGSGLLARP